MNIKNRKQQGFTIIEVLIVLAIAGLIMLIVFLAVPSLQRSQRNNARNSDASRISSTVTECLANRNGDVPSCDSAAEISAGTLSQLTTLNFEPSSSGTRPVSSNIAAGIWFGKQCDTAGADVATGTVSTRQFVVLYTLENNITRCIGS